jgi:hypothetical protein
MKNLADQNLEKKNKSNISIRVDPDVLLDYERCIETANITLANAIRTFMLLTNQQYDLLEENGFSIEFTFNPISKEASINFEEKIGSFQIKVTPPKFMSVEVLHQLVFALPEFFMSNSNNELIRVDAAHFLRVASKENAIVSRLHRNVLSYRLYKNQCYVSVFKYFSNQSIEEIKQNVIERITQNIKATIACYLTNQLPESRILSGDDIKNFEIRMLEIVKLYRHVKFDSN